MNIVSKRYTRPKLHGHSILYRGRRWWIFAIDKNHPYEGHEEYANLVVYDCLNDCIMITGVLDPKNGIKGDIIVGQDSIEVTGQVVQDFLKSAIQTWKFVDPDFK